MPQAKLTTHIENSAQGVWSDEATTPPSTDDSYVSFAADGSPWPSGSQGSNGLACMELEIVGDSDTAEDNTGTYYVFCERRVSKTQVVRELLVSGTYTFGALTDAAGLRIADELTTDDPTSPYFDMLASTFGSAMAVKSGANPDAGGDGAARLLCTNIGNATSFYAVAIPDDTEPGKAACRVGLSS